MYVQTSKSARGCLYISRVSMNPKLASISGEGCMQGRMNRTRVRMICESYTLGFIRREKVHLVRDSGRIIIFFFFFWKRPRFSVASSSLGRFSKSTSRLVGDYEKEEQLRSIQTLPRNLHSTGGGQTARSQTASQIRRHQATHIGRHGKTQGQQQQHSSMINVSIKNAVSTPPPKLNSTTSAYSTLQAPPKPERTYKSSLSRSKSFNVEVDKNGVDASPTRTPYTSNLHLNRLDETPPLKSPGILASISRSNRDLLREGKY